LNRTVPTSSPEAGTGSRSEPSASFQGPAPRFDEGQAESAPAERPAGIAAEPNLDRMLREIFEGRGPADPATPVAAEESTQPAPLPAPPQPERADHASMPSPVDAEPAPSQDEQAGEGREADAEAGKKQSLLERLRVV
jgi:hypothetical protein